VRLIFTVYLRIYLHINTFDIHNRLHIQSRSLDVVYNPAAVKWLADFFTRPHQAPDAQLRHAARHRYEAMKQKTKQEFMRNWEQILEGKLVSSLAL
jgi:vacuolar protein sorting-associated protein 13D